MTQVNGKPQNLTHRHAQTRKRLS